MSGPNRNHRERAPLVTTPESSAGSIRAQKLAAPSGVYIEAFTGHPLESEIGELFAAPDAYLDDGVPMYKAVLRPRGRAVPAAVSRPPSRREPVDGRGGRGGCRGRRLPAVLLPGRAAAVRGDRPLRPRRPRPEQLLSRLAEYEFYGVAPPGASGAPDTISTPQRPSLSLRRPRRWSTSRTRCKESPTVSAMPRCCGLKARPRSRRPGSG